MGVGLVCGKVSGNLEMLELEGRATSEETLLAICDKAEELGVGTIWDSLITYGYAELTPSGGLHLLYRISDHDVPGNTKVARRPATPEELAQNPDDRIKVLAETRGEGGYVIVAPSGGTVHPTGYSWDVQAGEIGRIPTITWDERCLLHEAVAKVLDEMPEPAPPPPRPVLPTTPGRKRPGDDFNERAPWDGILVPHGWRVHSERGQETFWTRPGKNVRDGHSASTGYSADGDRLYVWSSATPFEPETPYSKFAAYATLNHGGDHVAAARTLGNLGYGEQRTPVSNVDRSIESPPLVRPETQHPERKLPQSRGRQDYTLEGAAARFVRNWGNIIRYVIEEKSWRVWNGTLWEADETGAQVSEAFVAMTEVMLDELDQLDIDAAADPDKAPMAKAFRKHVHTCRNGNRANILSMIANKVMAHAHEFDADPRYLNLQNGVYDLAQDQFLPHDPKYMLTKTAAVAYDKDAKAPKTEAFLGELLPSEQMHEFTLQALAYSLTGEADRKAMFILQGIPNSGKTQITELAAKVFGDYAVSVSPGTFTKRREHGPNPELHNMRGARFVYTSETSYEIQLDEELVKRITGKDTMSTRTLYERPQQWIPQCSVWIATNNLPRFGSDSDAMWRRVKTIRFVNEFTDDGSSGHLAQPNIGRTLAREEGSGLFNLLLEALRRYRAAGSLVEPPELKESVSAHREETDPLVQWVTAAKEMGHLVPDPDGEASQGAMRKAYASSSQDEGYTPLGAQRFGNAISALLGGSKRRSNGETLIKGWRFTPPAGGWIIGQQTDRHQVDQE